LWYGAQFPARLICPAASGLAGARDVGLDPGHAKGRRLAPGATFNMSQNGMWGDRHAQAGQRPSSTQSEAEPGIARRTSSSGLRNQHSEVMSAGRRPGGPTECDTEPATFKVRHEISSNFSSFRLPNAVPMQQNHSVSGSEISGCSQPYLGPPVDLRKAANGQSERMAAFGTAHLARERRGWALHGIEAVVERVRT
jgi:hypothetical protein